MLVVVKQQLLQLLKLLELLLLLQELHAQAALLLLLLLPVVLSLPLLLLLLLPLERQQEGQQPLLLPRRPDSCRPSCRVSRSASCRAWRAAGRRRLVETPPGLRARATRTATDWIWLARAWPGRDNLPVCVVRLAGRAGKESKPGGDEWRTCARRGGR
jgi:hypothetical protein